MMGWQAIVPIKQGAFGKSRLAPLLDPAQRERLVVHMADHVLDTLAGVAAIERIAVLSPRRHAAWSGAWCPDLGRGLNAELAAWRGAAGDGPVVVVHADLPLLRASDIDALLAAAATHGLALAHDRAGGGTNALALADRRAFRFRFGPDSCRRHRAQYPGMAVVTRDGLMTDIDTPDDVRMLCPAG